MSAEVRIFELWNPDALDRPGVARLFGRCYAGGRYDATADDVRSYVQQYLADSDKSIRLWVAKTDAHGYCGLAIVGMATCPLAPHPWISQFFVEVAEARAPLLHALLLRVSGEGYRSVATQNATGHSDEAHMRLYRNFSKGEGEVRGSVIVYELGDQYGR